MWPNSNGFDGHGGYHPEIGAGNYQYNFNAGDGFIRFLPDGTDQQFSQPSPQMQYHNQDGDSYMQDFQPEVGLYNEQQFTHNSYYEMDSPNRFPVQQPSNALQITSRSGPELDARTRELKAKLMEGMAQRAQSGTPPVSHAAITRPSKSTEGNSSLRESPITPVAKSPSTEIGSVLVTADDVEDLLSQHRPIVKSREEQESTRVISGSKKAQHQHLKSPYTPLKEHALTPVKLTNIQQSKALNGKTDHNHNIGGDSEADEWEISEERHSIAAPSGKETLSRSNLQPAVEQMIPKTQKKEIESNSQSQNGRGTSPNLLRSPVQSLRAPPHHQDERYDSSELRFGTKTAGPSIPYERRSQPNDERKSQQMEERMPHQMKPRQIDERRSSQNDERKPLEIEEWKPHQIDEWKSQQINERKAQQDDERIPQNDYERRPHRDYEPRAISRRTPSEDQRRHEIKYDSNQSEVTPRKQDIPTLAQLLVVDEDLKEWLEITGYHNTEYRNKTLNRRRALAALDAQRAKMDAQREKILEELEKEERGGGLLAGSAPTQSLPAPMLPPPFPNKTSVSLPKPHEAPTPERDERLLKPETGTKRTYQDYRGSRIIEDNAEKNGRLDEEGRGFRTKGEHDGEDRRRSSASDSRDYRQSGSEASHHIEDRGRGFGRGSDSDISPGLQAFHDRPPARPTSHGWYEQGEPRDDNGPGERRDPRPYVVIGNYRGRDYDPNYRGRGRGRGNWIDKHNDRDQNNHQSQQQQQQQKQQQQQPQQPQEQQLQKQQRNPEQWRAYGQRIANGPARKWLINWDKGGKGETRYFIVKSFNEENVVRCIQDSIWTTQIQNGDIFTEAYHNCKNVILVFSINQSRAFQGYARMAGLPGTEQAPQWQKSINWESAGAFKVSWITIAATRFSRVGHLKNSLNEGQAVLIGKDGQEIEERCGEELLKLIDEEADRQISGEPYAPVRRFRDPEVVPWDD